MSNTAPTPANGSNGATSIVDSAGTPIIVGSLVKVDCVVTAINPFSTRFGELTLQPVNLGNNPGLSAVPSNNISVLQDMQNGVAVPGITGNPFKSTPALVTVGT